MCLPVILSKPRSPKIQVLKHQQRSTAMTSDFKQPQSEPTPQKLAEQPARRSWVTPTFERQPLKDALANVYNQGSFDGVFYYS
jgi:hypothetical protein